MTFSVTGLALDADEYDSDHSHSLKPTLIHIPEAQLYGITIIQRDSTPHIAFDMRTTEYDDTAPRMPKIQRFYIEPDEQNIAVFEHEPFNAFHSLQGVTAEAREMIEHPDFSRFNPNERRELLAKLCEEAEMILDDFHDDRKEPISCVSDDFYVIYDGSSLSAMAEHRVKRTELSLSPAQLQGTNYKIFYPETVIQPSSDFKNPEDFYIGRRYPCLSLRDDERGLSFWIPLDSIRSLTTRQHI